MQNATDTPRKSVSLQRESSIYRNEAKKVLPKNALATKNHKMKLASERAFHLVTIVLDKALWDMTKA
jgi:hypothetical protein